MARDDAARSRQVVARDAVRLARLDASRISQEVRELRLGLNVSQAAVARVVGVSQSVISDLERGDPTLEEGLDWPGDGILWIAGGTRSIGADD